VCGDLTSAFNFRNSDAEQVALPRTSSYEPADRERHADYVPTPPSVQSVPRQERGVRRARALPYEVRVEGTPHTASGAFRIDFRNTGKAGVCLQVRSDNSADGPWAYTVEPDKALANSWNLAANHGRYDFSVFGPNGFLRRFRGRVARDAADLDVDVRYDVDDYALIIRVSNQSRAACRVTLASAYDRKSLVDVLPRGRALEKRWPLKSSFGWYDLEITTDADRNFLRRVAGHLENGRDSVSDPALGGVSHDAHIEVEA
jgi:phospholipase C